MHFIKNKSLHMHTFHSRHKQHLCKLSRNVYVLNPWMLILLHYNDLPWTHYTLGRHLRVPTHCTSYGLYVVLVTMFPFISSPNLILSSFSANFVSLIMPSLMHIQMFSFWRLHSFNIYILLSIPQMKNKITSCFPQIPQSCFPNSLSIHLIPLL